MKKHFISIIILLFSTCAFSNIYNRPRKIHVIQTKYFDIIYPNGAEFQAKKIATEGDELFEKAAKYFNLEKKFRLPVAITLDSDTPAVEYTPEPYNRITIYDSMHSGKEWYKNDSLITDFYESILLACASNKRNKFWQTTSNLLHMDELQPVTLLNLPEAFLRGAVENACYENNDSILKDGFCLSVLSEAKAESKFPKWIDCSGSKDNYDSNISYIAANAFTAFIIQRYGIELYTQYWNELGKVHFFKLNDRIFKKVYKDSISNVWNEFADSIPAYINEDSSEIIMDTENEGTYTNLIATRFGLIYYDSMHNEVSLFNGKKSSKLFTATKITNISISKDEKYLAISYDSQKTNSKLNKNRARIYDLENNYFIQDEYKLKNAVLVDATIDKLGIAGFSNENKNTELLIYKLNNSKNDIFYKKTLPSNIFIQDIISLDSSKLICIYYKNQKCTLHYIDYFLKTEKTFELPFIARNFNLQKDEDEYKLYFTFTEKNSYEQAKSAFIQIKDNSPTENIYIQESNFSGGTYELKCMSEYYYFSSHNTKCHALKRIEKNKLEYKLYDEKLIETSDIRFINENAEDNEKLTETFNFATKKYHPAKYIFKGSWIPFSPISNIDFTEIKLSPGLGATYRTNTDPVENIKSAFSFCSGYIDTNARTFTGKDEYILAAYTNTTIFPFDISLSGLFNFTQNGKYNLQTMIGTNWKNYIGFPENILTFGIKGLWKCDTTFIDYEKNEKIELEDWPSIKDAGNTFAAYLSIDFQNYHQHGKSTFQQKGIKADFSLIGVFDPKKSDKKISDINELFQITFSAGFGFKLPYIIPVFGVDDWIICMPLSFYTKIYEEEEKSSNSNIEVLLAGYEIQKGIPGLNIYFQRCGIKAGYNLSTIYNGITTSETDFRNIKQFINIFKESRIEDYLYLSIETTFSPIIGKFSNKTKITAGISFQADLRNAKGNVKAVFNMNL